MRIKTNTKLAYEAPATSVDMIALEQTILSAKTRQLQDMDTNEMYDEDF